jgi:hypothetical protein
VGTPQQLAVELSRYRKSWVEAVESGASLHRKVAEDEIANEHRRQLRLAELSKKKKAEEQYLRQLFRKKNYLDE